MQELFYHKKFLNFTVNQQHKLRIMKNTLLLLTLVFMAFSGFGQGYQPFPTANAKWREKATGYQCSCCSDYQLIIPGDTVINSLTYHKIQKTGMNFIEDVNGSCTDIGSGIIQYKGCFRNDSLNKLVYFMWPNSTTEEVLYDFNLEVGDTVPSSLLNQYGDIVNVVEDIDTVFLAGVYRKRFALDTCDWEQLYYIEGIGSTYGLLSPTRCPFEAIYELLCFSVDSIPIYPDNSLPCSSVIANTETLQINSFSIFPNPTSASITISLPENTIESVAILFDAAGKEQLRLKVQGGDNNVDVSKLKHGIYLLQIGNSRVSFQKE
jgi:hypothetical protein